MLDVACGTGKLGGHDRREYIGVDLSMAMLRKAKKANFTVVAGDAGCLCFKSESFDAVNCDNIIEHLPPAAASAMINEAARVLRPGGVLLLRTPLPATVWNTFSHIRPYPPDAIRKLLSTETESYVRSETGIPLEIEFVLYYGTFFGNRLLRVLSFAVGALLPIGRTGYAMVLRKRDQK